MNRPVFALAALVLLSAPAAAQTDYRGPVLRELELYAEQHSDYVVSFTGAGRMSKSAPIEIALYVTAGKSYRLRASCDRDCTDVDMAVRSASGETLGSDFLADDYPIVAFTSTRTGTVTAQITMPSCTTTWCYYGLIALEK